MPRRPVPPNSVYRWTPAERHLFLAALRNGIGVYDSEEIAEFMCHAKTSREIGVYRRWWARRNPELFIRARSEYRSRKRYPDFIKFLRTDETLETDEPWNSDLEFLFALPELDYYSDRAA